VEGFGLKKAFNSSMVVNAGVGGYETYDVRKAIGKVIRSRPDKIIIAVGINDIRKNIPVDSAIKNISATIEAIQNDSSINIYVNSLFPVYKGYSNLNDRVIDFNSNLDSLCKSKGVVFINVYDHFKDKSYFTDGLHLTSGAYDKWGKILANYKIGQ
jgi:lysophospholipase L1-like esterase